jgi:hypothetical protein
MLQYIRMDTSMKQPQDIELPNQAPEIKPDRRSFMLQVMLPLVIGVLILIAGVVLLGRSGVGTASAWADTSLIFLLIPWLCVGVFPLALLAAFWYGLFRLTAWLPAPMRTAKLYIDRAGGYLRKGSDLAVRPIFTVKGAWAVASAIIKGLASFFRIDDGESHG